MPFQYNIQNPELLRGLQNAEMQQNAPIYLQETPTVNQPAQYINQAITPPAEKVQTPNEINQQYTGEKYQLFKDNFPYASNNLTPREFDMKSRLYDLKTQYQGLQETINNLDAEKDKDKISTLRNAQKDVADSADVLRGVANGMGYNTKGLGAENTFDEATRTIQMDMERGMMNLLDMPSTSAQMRDVYKGARQMGYSPSEARDIAGRFHDEFRETNTQRLVEGIGAYGTNSDGSLNEFGQRLLGKLAYESPYHYQTITNGFANPRDIFSTNADMSKLLANNEAAMQRALEQYRNAWNIANLNEYGKNARFDVDQQNKLTIEDAKLQMKLAEIGQKSPLGQFQGYVDLGKYLYGDDQAKVMEFAFEHFNGGNKGEKNKKPSVGTMNGYKAIVSAITKGEDDSAQAMFESLKKQKADNVGKFYDGWSDEEIKIESDLDKAISYYLNTEYNYATDEELKAQLEEAKQLLLDSVQVAGSGYTVKDIQDARNYARHQARDKQPEKDNVSQNVATANQNVRNILESGGYHPSGY